MIIIRHGLLPLTLTSLICGAVTTPFPCQHAVASPLAASASVSRWTSLDNGTLKDATTALEWTSEDNGGDIDWADAKAYCGARPKGWRLPRLQELMTIFDPSETGTRCDQALCKVSLKFNLTGAWFWSATQVGSDSTDGNELAWGVLMVNGAKTQAVREASYGSRVLCVRNQLQARGDS